MGAALRESEPPISTGGQLRGLVLCSHATGDAAGSCGTSLVLPSGAWHRAMGTYGPDTETLKATGPSLPIEANHLPPSRAEREYSSVCLPEDYPCRGAPGSRGRAAEDPKAMDIPPTALLLGPHWVQAAGNTALSGMELCVLGRLTSPGSGLGLGHAHTPRVRALLVEQRRYHKLSVQVRRKCVCAPHAASMLHLTQWVCVRRASLRKLGFVGFWGV